ATLLCLESPPKMVFDCVYDARLIFLSQIVIERQPQQAIAYILGDRAIAVSSAKSATHDREVQRQVVENARNAAIFQVSNHCLALRKRGYEQIKHVVRLLAMAWHERNL